jgi:hypothetical protein
MDPSLFRIDLEVLAEVLTAIIVLSFFVERALSLVFEHRLYIHFLEDKGFKELIAFAVSWVVVAYWQFDAVGVLLQADTTSPWGYIITAAIIAGGSKASIKLFQDVFKSMSTTEKLRKEAGKKA